MNKTWLFFILVMIYVIGARAQNMSDHKLVLKKCLELQNFQQFKTLTDDDNPRPTFIMQGDYVFPEEIVLSDLRRHFVFMSEAQIRAYQTKTYFTFRKFELQEDSAQVVFDFYHGQINKSSQKVASVIMNLQKNEIMWEIVESNIKWN